MTRYFVSTLLALCISCTADTDVTHSALTANVSGECVQKDVGSSEAFASFFGNFTKDNPNNCVNNPAICEGLGLGFFCKADSGCCTSGDSGACNKTPDCTNNAKAVCIERACVPCKADTECAEWSSARRDSRNLCISGVCKECRGTTDCKDPAKPVCDTMIGSDTINQCYSCRKNSDCPGTNVCKTDEAIADSQAALGACLKPTEIVYVNNAAGCSDTGTGTATTPFCQLNAAVSSGKTYIQVAGSSTPYLPITVTGAGVRIIVLGPGRDSSPSAIIGGAHISASASVTFVGLEVTRALGAAAVTCASGASVYLREVSTKKSVEGVNASCSKAWIENSRIQNASDGGINISGSTNYRIVNSSVTFSGTASAPYGVNLGGISSGYFSFNTIAKNLAGVICSAGQRISDSIVSTNLGIQIDAGCSKARVNESVVINAGTAASPTEPALMSLTDEALLVDKTTQAEVDADLKALQPLQIKVGNDYALTARPKGNGYDIGHKELR